MNTNMTPSTFVFCVTKLCDKRCLVCCNNQERVSHSMDYEAYRQKLMMLAEYIRDTEYESRRPRIILTGGECFLYRTRDRIGGTKNILDLVLDAKDLVPSAALILKTTGWLPNRRLDWLLERMFEGVTDDSFSIRLGLNLYQNDGRDAEDRFGYMLERILSYQDQVLVDCIYDKDNFEDTMKVWSRTLSPFDLTALRLRESVEEDPSEHQGYLFVKGSKLIRLELGPSYSPSSNCDDREYWDEKNPGLCRRIESGVDQLFYDYDLSVCHCNDSYVDATVPFIWFGKCHSIADEVLFFQQRLRALRDHLQETSRQFATRKQRCFYCTRFVLQNGD